MTTKTDNAEVFISKVEQAQLTFCILGLSPLICNRMSEKARQELLLPSLRKTAATKATTLKHDPLTEYRDSPYRNLASNAPTRLQLLASMFKKAMMTAALDIPGAKKTQIGRLLYLAGDRIDLYGQPEMFMAVTRSADMNRTPDVRTRAILREWACRITIRFTVPIIKDVSVANLLAAAGTQAGVGDFRVEKGAGSYGTFEPVSADNKDWQRIAKIGRVEQDKALKSPGFYDDETASLFTWFEAEVPKRGLTTAAKIGG